jgi:hypothetical protein
MDSDLMNGLGCFIFGLMLVACLLAIAVIVMGCLIAAGVL